MDKSSKVTSAVGVAADYEAKDAMIFGNNKARALDSINAAHPLQDILAKFDKKQDKINMRTLKVMQGIHAPMRIQMEKMAVKDIGHLPCLHRHNALLDALTGKDMTLDFDDFLNDPRDSEVMGHPHIMVERHLGML